MKTLIIKTEIPIAGGSEFRLTVGHGNAIELTESKRIDKQMQPEEFVLRIPSDKRAEIADFIINAK